MTNLAELSFYHTELKHDEVLHIMAKYGNQYGIYLMRDSREGSSTKTISVMHSENLLNFRISMKENKFHIGDIPFDSIPLLAKHFKTNPVTNDMEYKDVYLKTPICRFHGLSSWRGLSLDCCSPPETIYFEPSNIKADKDGLYVNKNSGQVKSEESTEPITDFATLKVSMQNNWSLEPVLVFKDPEGNINQSLPSDVWINASTEEMSKIKKLRKMFPLVENVHGFKKIGSSRSYSHT